MTGLVLEGGAVRTIYSSGVCDGFLEQNFWRTLWWACPPGSPMV